MPQKQLFQDSWFLYFADMPEQPSKDKPTARV